MLAKPSRARAQTHPHTHIHTQGVAAPSQIRYVCYIDALLCDPRIDYRSPRIVLLEKITINSIPMAMKESIKVSFVVEVNGQLVYDSIKIKGITRLHKQVRRQRAAACVCTRAR